MSWLAALIGGAQGGIAGSIASHPFDVCSLAVVRGAAANGFGAAMARIKSEGFLGLWRGSHLNALMNAVNKSIYFLLYAWLAAAYCGRTGRRPDQPLPYTANLLVGYLSQLGSVPFVQPLCECVAPARSGCSS